MKKIINNDKNDYNDYDEIGTYILFLYCLYKGISIVNTQIAKEEVIKKVIKEFYNDPIFHRIVKMSRDLFPECWK